LVSVLFKLADEEGNLLPSGWTVQGAKVEEWPHEETRRALIGSHFGARRFANNWALAKVKADLADHRSTPWTMQVLRRAFNEVKDEVAPWWRENSKECYASGITDVVTALKNSSDAKRASAKAGGVPPRREEAAG
jgi:putative transposase